MGINPLEEHPGYQQFISDHVPDRVLPGPKAEYDSIRGRIISDWRIDGDRFTLKLQIPPGATAIVYLPSSDASASTESGHPAGQTPGVQSMGSEGNDAVYRVESGRYEFRVADLSAVSGPRRTGRSYVSSAPMLLAYAP